MTAEQVTDQRTESLRANAGGLPDVIFTSVTTMAPAAGAAFSITVGALFAGGAHADGVIRARRLHVHRPVHRAALEAPAGRGRQVHVHRARPGRQGGLPGLGWGFDLAYPLVVPLVSVLFGSILGSTVLSPFARGWGRMRIRSGTET